MFTEVDKGVKKTHSFGVKPESVIGIHEEKVVKTVPIMRDRLYMEFFQ